MFLLSGVPAPWNAKPIPLGSAESKKEAISLRPLRLSGDFKLSNYNTIPYLRIRALSCLCQKTPVLQPIKSNGAICAVSMPTLQRLTLWMEAAELFCPCGVINLKNM